MKRLIEFLAIAFLVTAIWALFQVGNHATAQDLPKPADKVLKDTVINNVSHKLYIGSRGGKYILVTSKTGKTYKRYFTAKKTN